MLYAIHGFLVAFFFLLYGYFLVPKVKSIKDDRERTMYALKIVQSKLRRILKVCKVKYDVEGMENLTSIPKDEGVMFVGNHRSYFDVILGYTLVDRPTGFVAKTEMQKVKPLAMWMEFLHCLFIDRDNLKQSLKVILQAIQYVKKGTSIWIYPEGTRSKGESEEDMLPFKEGSFKIAEKTGCKIIPVAMINTRKIWEAQFPKVKPNQHVRVMIGKPITVSDIPEEERKHVGEYVEHIVLEEIRELKKKDVAEEK